MIVHLSVHTPKPGKRQDLIDSMHRFGAAGIEAMRAAVADDPFDEREAAEVEGFFLEAV